MASPGDTAEHLGRQISVLQQLQCLLTSEATLADAKNLLASIEADYGVESRLEDVIQCLIGEYLAHQIEQRRAVRRQRQGSQ